MKDKKFYIISVFVYGLFLPITCRLIFGEPGWNIALVLGWLVLIAGAIFLISSKKVS